MNSHGGQHAWTAEQSITTAGAATPTLSLSNTNATGVGLEVTDGLLVKEDSWIVGHEWAQGLIPGFPGFDALIGNSDRHGANILIATGCKMRRIPDLPVDGERRHEEQRG